MNPNVMMDGMIGQWLMVVVLNDNSNHHLRSV